MGHVHGPMLLGGLFPLVAAKGGLLVMNIDIVKFEMGPTFPSGLDLLPALHGLDELIRHPMSSNNQIIDYQNVNIDGQ